MPRAKNARECWAGTEDWEYRVYGAEGSLPEVRTCRAHAGDTVAALFTAQASLVMIPNPGARPGSRRFPTVDYVLEQARRAGAHSRDQRMLEIRERELHVAVLAAIADGAPMPQQMAAAALATLRYGHERERS